MLAWTSTVVRTCSLVVECTAGLWLFCRGPVPGTNLDLITDTDPCSTFLYLYHVYLYCNMGILHVQYLFGIIYGAIYGTIYVTRCGHIWYHIWYHIRCHIRYQIWWRNVIVLGGAVVVHWMREEVIPLAWRCL